MSQYIAAGKFGGSRYVGRAKGYVEHWGERQRVDCRETIVEPNSWSRHFSAGDGQVAPSVLDKIKLWISFARQG